MWSRGTQAEGLPKLADAEQVGNVSACDTPVTPVVGEVILCLNCDKPGVLRCTQCKAARYCSKECQRKTQDQHGKICASIVELERMQKEDRYREKTVRQNQLNQKIKLKLVKLVGSDQLSLGRSRSGSLAVDLVRAALKAG